MSELFVRGHSCCFYRPAPHVLLVNSAQTSQPRPPHVQMDLTAWVLLLFALSAQLGTTARLTAKTLCHFRVLLVITATNQHLCVQIAVLDMLVRVQIFLQHHPLAYAQSVITVLMVCKKFLAHQVHLET